MFAQKTGELHGRVSGQATSDDTPLQIDDVDRVPRLERALDRNDDSEARRLRRRHRKRIP